MFWHKKGTNPMDSEYKYDGKKFKRMVYNFRVKYDLTALDLTALRRRIKIIKNKLSNRNIRNNRRTLLNVTHAALCMELGQRKRFFNIKQDM
jgi:hypothetical protein